jgi:GDP-4-dehydro-6-deoxy-D-mannose reductase
VAASILVTGAAGFVGGHLLDRLRAAGSPIVGWYRPGSDTGLLPPGPQWIAVEMLDRDAVAQAVAAVSPSAVYHLAGSAHVAQSWQFVFDTYRTNVMATHYLLSALVKLETKPRVLVSCSATVYEAQDAPLTEESPLQPQSPYATSKLAQELLAMHVHREDGLPIVVARSFNHTGPGQEPSYVAPGIARQIACIEAGQQEPLLRMGNLEPRRDLSDVRDVVRAYELMLNRGTPGQVYNVCSGRALSIGQLVETFVSRARVKVEVVQDPALFRPADAPVMVGSHQRLTADTGWRPDLPLTRTIDDLLAYWRQRVPPL